MLITRKTQVPGHWVFYAQLPFVMSIAGHYITGAPFLYAMKKFIDNPAAITFLLSIEVFVTMLGGPFVSWLSDRVWTRYGRRRPFIVAADIPKAIAVMAMPFAPDLMTLIVLRWIYGILGDIASPNQALTMEIVPAKQRGMGAGYFKLQGQVVNVFFFLLVVGRFDDVYFTGPLHALFAVPGETLIFLAGGILFLAVAFYTWFGIHEVEPPDRQSVRDEQRPGEPLVKLFLRTFFRDVFHSSLLPLYLLMMVGTLTGVSLGTLAPLLYTEQWGYSLQEMGTNIAISSAIGVVAALFAGWIADRTSKMKVYTFGLVMALVCRVIWTIYVYNKPGFRPDLHEIVLFGTIGNVFSLIAAAASFPLILEYVERNRLGTAGAGMGLFSSTVRNGFTMFTGFFILWWSIFLLPQAGDRVKVVLDRPVDANALQATLAAAGLPAGELDLKPVFRPGTDGVESRQWSIRRPVEAAGDIHKEIKDLGTLISKKQLKLQRPALDDASRASLEADIVDLRREQDELKARLAASADSFEEQLIRALDGQLAVEGQEILDARIADGGTRLSLTLAMVEPVDVDITPRTYGEILGFSDGLIERRNLVGEYARLMQTPDLNFLPPAEGLVNYQPELTTSIAGQVENAITFELVRDPDFVGLENALLLAGAVPADAYILATDILLPLRGLTRQSSSAYSINDPAATLDQIGFELVVVPDEKPLPEGAVADAFTLVKGIREARVTGESPRYRVELELEPLPAASVDVAPTAIGLRLRELLPGATRAELASLESLVRRATETAAAPPLFLTVARPVVSAQPVDREYDYFFSMQYFMILTDVMGILIIIFIVSLEKRGRIVRLGALEDANR